MIFLYSSSLMTSLDLDVTDFKTDLKPNAPMITVINEPNIVKMAIAFKVC